jgi:hypothetical protein
LRNPIEASPAATSNRRRLSSAASNHCEEVIDGGSLWAQGGGELGGSVHRGGGGLFIGERGVLQHGTYAKAVVVPVDCSSGGVAAQ